MLLNQGIKKSERRSNRTNQLNYVVKEVMAIKENKDFIKTTDITINDADLTTYYTKITPIEGLYAGIAIEFLLEVPPDYPSIGNPIKPLCLTKIYHPNLFDGGRVCLHLDNFGNYESGFKETFESVIYGLNYLFLNPGNVKEEDMTESVKNTYRKNIEQYKIQQKLSAEKKLLLREFYSKELNKDILNISKTQDIKKYFPEKLLEDMKDIDTQRIVMCTLGGNKEMSLTSIDTVMAQLMRDPRVSYKMMNIPKQITTIKNPKHRNEGNTVKIMKFANIFSPNNLHLQHMRIRCDEKSYVESELYHTGASIGDLANIGNSGGGGVHVFTNIIIESNYDIILGITYDVKDFNIACVNQSTSDNHNNHNNQDIKTFINEDSIKNMGSLSNERNNTNYPEDIIIFHPLKIGKNIKIDVLMDCNFGVFVDIIRLPIYISPDYEKTPDVVPYIKINGSILIYGHELVEKFNNTYLKLNPFDPNSPYLKYFDNKKGLGYSLLNKNELLLVSDKNHITDSIKKIDQRDSSIMNTNNDNNTAKNDNNTSKNDNDNTVSQKEIDDIFESLVSGKNKGIHMRDMIDMYISSNMGQSGLEFPKILNGHQ